MSDDRLRDLYARTVRIRADHVSPDDILALVQKTGDEDGRLSILDHVMSCAECRREFDLVRAIDSASDEAARKSSTESITPDRPVIPIRPKRTHTFWQSGYTRMLAAAMILTVVGIGVDTVHKRADRTPETTRGGASGKVIALASPDSTALTIAPVILAWHPSPGAAQYRVEVLDANNSLVNGGTTTDTTFAVPATVLQRGDYSWWVRARTTSGDVSSPLRRLRITTNK